MGRKSHLFRPRSRRMLAFELRRKGLDNQDIQEAIEQVDDEALAYQAALGHTRKLRNLEWRDFRVKMYAFLARRGFSHETAAARYRPCVGRNAHR